MLNLWIDATPVRGNLSGIGFYTLSLIDALSRLQTSQSFNLQVYCHPSLKNWLLRKRAISDRLQPYAPIITLPVPVTLADQVAKLSSRLLPSLDRRLNAPNLLHGTDHYVYPGPAARKIMTIHDLTFIKYPHYATSIVQSYRSRIQRCLAGTDGVITFAQSTKQDIVDYFQVEPSRIFLTPQASRYSADTLELESLESLKSELAYDFSRPYLLFVSTLEPRKNVEGLISAFNQLKQQAQIPHQLVLIGQWGWKYESILRAIANSPFSAQIHSLQYLSDRALALFYKHAEVFIYPSFYEGFGLPVLEAMTLGAPVITSNCSSLPEVTGEAAILINPHDSNAIATAIWQVINDAPLRQAMIKKGKARAQQFSWEKTAKATLEAYRSILAT
jgi:glycosyltransferase involved in cell wall biosynthesis